MDTHFSCFSHSSCVISFNVMTVNTIKMLIIPKSFFLVQISFLSLNPPLPPGHSPQYFCRFHRLNMCIVELVTLFSDFQLPPWHLCLCLSPILLTQVPQDFPENTPPSFILEFHPLFKLLSQMYT